MADISKIAGTFEARRLTVGVEPNKLGWFIKRCLEMGIQINPTNELKDDNVVCRVTLPADSVSAFNDRPETRCCMLLKSERIWLMCPLPKTEVVFPIWRTVKPGGFKSAQEFRGAAKNAGVDICQQVFFAIETLNLINTISENLVDLARVSVAELGFQGRTRRDEVYEHALDLGLRPCSAVDALKLRLQYNDQPNGEYLVVCSEPLADSEGCLFIIVIECSASNLRIGYHHAEPATLLDMNTQLIFSRPRK